MFVHSPITRRLEPLFGTAEMAKTLDIWQWTMGGSPFPGSILYLSKTLIFTFHLFDDVSYLILSMNLMYAKPELFV
jgi:hypothetical protein